MACQVAWMREREETMVLSFDDLASHFDEQRGLPVAALREWAAAVDLFAAGRTLEIVEPGIGTGRVTLPLAVSGHRVTGVDVSEAMLQACAHKADALRVGDRVTLLQGDATALPLPDHAFDLGVMASLLYLVPDWTEVLDELHRVVKPGGSVVHLVERSESGDELRLWDIAWRSRVESAGFQHASLQPAPEVVQAEFLRRWPDTRIEILASWEFGQTVGEAMDGYGERLRPLYAEMGDDEWSRIVGDFLYWAGNQFPDPETRLAGQVVLEAMISRT
jgi:ubiquinone/menaquinone biosynthesis C-methylase UbiE